MAESKEEIRAEFIPILKEIITSQEELLKYTWLDDQLRVAAEKLLKSAREALVLVSAEEENHG